MVCDNYGQRYVPDQERIHLVIRIPRLNKLYAFAIGGHRSLFDVDAVVTSVSWPPVILVAGNGWLDWLCAACRTEHKSDRAAQGGVTITRVVDCQRTIARRIVRRASTRVPGHSRDR